MSRLNISCTEQEKQEIKIFAAMQNKSISAALLDCFREKAALCDYGFSHVPNEETKASIKDSEKGIGVKEYKTLEDLFNEN